MLACDNRLPELANEINHHAACAQISMQNGLAHAIACGKALIEAKSYAKHGDWEMWLQANCPEISLRLARVYRQVALNTDKLGQNGNAVADFSLRQAVRQIATTTGRIAKLPVPVVKKALKKGDDNAIKTELMQAETRQKNYEADRRRDEGHAAAATLPAVIGAFQDQQPLEETLPAPERKLFDQLEFVIGRYLAEKDPDADHRLVCEMLNELYNRVQDGDLSATKHRDRWPGYGDGKEISYEVEVEVEVALPTLNKTSAISPTQRYALALRKLGYGAVDRLPVDQLKEMIGEQREEIINIELYAAQRLVDNEEGSAA